MSPLLSCISARFIKGVMQAQTEEAIVIVKGEIEVPNRASIEFVVTAMLVEISAPEGIWIARILFKDEILEETFQVKILSIAILGEILRIKCIFECLEMRLDIRLLRIVYVILVRIFDHQCIFLRGDKIIYLFLVVSIILNQITAREAVTIHDCAF